MNKSYKSCPFSQSSKKDSERTEDISDYFTQRITFPLENDENSLKVSIPSFNTQKSLINIRSQLFETLKKINQSSSALSTLDYYRVKIKEKVQDQQLLYKMSEDVTVQNLSETEQKLKDLQEKLELRKSLVLKILQKQENQIKVQDEIGELKIKIQQKKKEIIENKAILLLDQVKSTRIDRESYPEDAIIRENTLNCDREILEIVGKYEKTLQEKNKFKDELNQNATSLREQKEKLINENKKLLEALKKPKITEKIHQQSEWINQDSKFYINFQEEIEEIKTQIQEFKELQRFCINERCNLLEPFSQLNKYHELKKQDLLENELNQISQNFSEIFQKKEEKLIKTSEKISKVLKFFTSQLKEKTLQKAEDLQSQLKFLVSSYKDLLNECKSTELLIKSLDIKDKRLDSFKIENNLEN
jgi:hypothetical protein